jgi:hypothetical protein
MIAVSFAVYESRTQVQAPAPIKKQKGQITRVVTEKGVQPAWQPHD